MFSCNLENIFKFEFDLVAEGEDWYNWRDMCITDIATGVAHSPIEGLGRFQLKMPRGGMPESFKLRSADDKMIHVNCLTSQLTLESGIEAVSFYFNITAEHKGGSLVLVIPRSFTGECMFNEDGAVFAIHPDLYRRID